MFLASKTCYWEQSWRLLRNRLWNMIWGVDHSTLQTKSSSFFIIRGNPVLTTGSSSLRLVLWKWYEQKFMCRNNISKLTLFKKVRLITPKLQERLITPPDANNGVTPRARSYPKFCEVSPQKCEASPQHLRGVTPKMEGWPLTSLSKITIFQKQTS